MDPLPIGNPAPASGIVHVIPVAFEGVFCFLDRRGGGFIGPWRGDQEILKCAEQFPRRMMSQGMEDLCTPRSSLLFVPWKSSVARAWMGWLA